MNQQMMGSTGDATNAADREIVTTRIYDAPRELVFDAWTDPKHVAHWWGPNGFTNTIHEMDVRPGGVWRFIMHGPDGVDYQNKIVYLEIVKPELLVYDHVSGPRFQATVTFEEQGGKTKVTMRALFETAEVRKLTVEKFGAIEGGKQTLARLAEHLQGMIADREFALTRVFDAPRERVFKAWTEPERLAEWWGPKGFTMRVCKLDLRPGGVFHYCMRAPDGRDMWGKFVYREIVAPERLVFVVSFAGEHGNPVRHPFSATWPLEVLNVLTFTDQDGKTTVALRGFPINATELERKTFEDGRGSMQQEFKGTLDQLVDYLKRVRAAGILKSGE
ncbi:MAG: SRPBCC domain-containing protein [Tepidisphaerales bacterium]